MKLTQNKINEVIVDILGSQGLNLVQELKGKENISEFDLANSLKQDIKLVRHMLYKLYNHNLVSSTRKKDKQKGWYVYYWTILPENLKYLYTKNKKVYLEKLKEKLEKEKTDQFFTCANKCVRLNFDQSMDFEFHCPECGELISQDINPKYMEQLGKQIEKLEKELIVKKVAKKKLKKAIKAKVVKKRIVKRKTTKQKVITKKKKVTKKKIVKKKIISKKSKKSIKNKIKKIVNKKLIKRKKVKKK